MRPLTVVVGGICRERPIEMASTLDERPVEALRPDSCDNSFGVRVGVGGSDRSQDHLGSLRAKDLVEWADELGVPVADEELDGDRAIVQLHRQVAGLLGNPGRIGVGGRGAQVDPVGVKNPDSRVSEP
jgi:hypothetical protein